MSVDIEAQFRQRHINYDEADLTREVKRCLKQMLAFHGHTLAKAGIEEPEEAQIEEQFIDDEFVSFEKEFYQVSILVLLSYFSLIFCSNDAVAAIDIAALQEKIARLTPEQRQHMDTILTSAREQKGELFYLDGPGGHGRS